MSGLIHPNVASESHDAVAYVSSAAARPPPPSASTMRPVEPVAEK
jgi:hypothetical protein